MIQFIVMGILTLLGLDALFSFFEDDPELKNIVSKKAVNKDYLIDQDYKKLSTSALKRQISAVINQYIKEDINGFKIGKTGNPKKRNKSSDYKEYEQMYLLCMTKDQVLIEELESYYTDKYFDNPKNDNKKRGSANKSVAIVDGKHFLYMVIR